MNLDKINKICKVLDILGHKNYILFMTEKEYELAFSDLYPFEVSSAYLIEKEPSLEKNILKSISFNGIVFHIVDIEK